MPTPTNIPAPPSGTIVDNDPLAQQQGAIPPPPSGSIVDNDPSQVAVPDSLNIDEDSAKMQNDSVLGRIGDGALDLAKRANALGAGMGVGLLSGINGAADLLHIPHALLQQREDELRQQNAGNPGLNTTGQGIETLAEFFTGDEALKGLALSDKLAKAGKIAEVFEKYPVAAERIGNAIRMGTVGATVSGLRGGAPAAVVGGLAGGIGGQLGGTPEADASATQGMEPWDAANPVEVKVQQQTANSGISAGEPSPTAEELETLKNTFQNNYHQDIRDVAEQSVKDSLSPTPANDGTLTGNDDASATPFDYDQPASLRDVYGKAARTVLQSAKDDFAALDEASGGRWQRFNDQISNVSNKMDEVAGIDDDAYNALEAKRIALEASQTKMVQEMKANGEVDPAIADRATSLYRKGMALQDVNKAVQTSTERIANPGVGVKEQVNPTKLSLRLQKLNDVPLDGGAPRLQQALGPDGAQKLIGTTDVANSLRDLDIYKPTTETGQAALKNLLRDNTVQTSTTGAKTDWNGVLKDFDGLGATKQRQMFAGEDLPKVRKLIRNRASLQRALPTTAKYIAGGTAGFEGALLLNKLLNPSTK